MLCRQCSPASLHAVNLRPRLNGAVQRAQHGHPSPDVGCSRLSATDVAFRAFLLRIFNVISRPRR